MRARHTFKLLVTGPCASATAALMQSVSRTAVVASTLPGVDSAGQPARTTVGIGVCDVPTTDVGEVKLAVIGIRGADASTPLFEVLVDEVDAVCVIVDASAPHTHSRAGEILRDPILRTRPFVVAVHGTADDAAARRLVRSLGIVPGGRVVSCQLGDPTSGREVVVFALECLLGSFGSPGTGQEVA